MAGGGGRAHASPSQPRLTGLPGYEKTLLYVDLMAALKKAAALRRFDLVYMRFLPVFHNAPGALAAVKAGGARLVVEHPTYPFENGKRSSLLRHARSLPITRTCSAGWNP